jgi:xylulokinase
MNVLVLNMGMKSIRSIIFNEQGCKLASSSKTLKSAVNDVRVEQFPGEWWDKAVDVMKNSIKDAGVKDIDYITVTTSASCLVCSNYMGEPIVNAIMVSDKRATNEVEIIKNLSSYEEVEKKTGLEVSVSLMLPKILWIKNHCEQEFIKTDLFLSPNDYLVYKLCGVAATDELNAAKYHYSVENNEYPTVLLEELGIPKEKLPKVMKTGEVVGYLKKDIAKEIGCKNNTKIVLSSYDAICSFVGSGVSCEGEASDVSGTVTVFRMLTKKNSLNESNQVYITPFHQGNYKIIGGSNNLGGGLIEWVKQCYYSKEEYPYEVMEKEANESEIGARGIIFLPYLLGERAPIWNDNARGVFFGLERMHTRKDMTRAVFEAAAFIDRTMMEAIGETSAEVKSVRCSGGLARFNLISQIKADVIGRDVIVLSEFETTASGAAMMVFNEQENMSFTELAQRFAKERMVIHPDMDNHKKYDTVYKLFKETYQQLLPLFDRRIELLKEIRNSKETQIENL